jgi:chaperonin GroES
MNIRPLCDRIVVKPIAGEEATRGGLVIPDTARKKPQEGEVVAVGRGRRLEDGERVAIDVRVGDRILFRLHAGSDTKVGGNEYVILREDDILGVLTTAA